jgi:hypothetical protein
MAELVESVPAEAADVGPVPRAGAATLLLALLHAARLPTNATVATISMRMRAMTFPSGWT